MPTICSSKTCCPITQRIEPKTSLNATLAGGSANWRSCRASADMGSKDGSHHKSRLERSLEEPGSEADTPSMVAIRRTLSADYRRWRRTGRCEAFGSQTPDLPVPKSCVRPSRGLDAYAASPGEVNREDKKKCAGTCTTLQGKGI